MTILDLTFHTKYSRPVVCLFSQVSLFQQILRNPDIFNFVDHSHHPVAVEVMKVAPAEMENREYASWKSLELLDTLLALADAGHSHAVMEMFQVGLVDTKLKYGVIQQVSDLGWVDLDVGCSTILFGQ